MKIKLLLFVLLFITLSASSFAQFETSTPEAQGISSQAILTFVERVENEVDALHSFMIIRNGKMISQGWWHPYDAETPHVMHSLSKSFTSTAVGLAIAEGNLSLDDQVISFFPDKTPDNPSQNLKAMRIRDLITMNTGHIEEPYVWQKDTDWIEFFLNAEVPLKPGTHFKYNSAATYMLSAIVQKVTGEKVVDYLTPRLFQPLGIKKPAWDESPQGISTGGWGLHIRTEDIAKLGQLYLQKGKWNGKQLLTEEWVALATSKQTANGSNPTSDWEQGYGFQFWRSRNDAYRGDGAFGQYCIVMPKQQTVIAITSGVNRMDKVLNIVWETLLPAMKDISMIENEQAFAALEEKTENLTLKPIEGEQKNKLTKKLMKRPYLIDDNKAGVQSVFFNIGGKKQNIVFGMEHGMENLTIGYGAYEKGEVESHLPYTNGLMKKTAASGAWISDNQYQVRTYLYEMPARVTYTFTFDKDNITMDTKVEHSLFAPRPQLQLKGHR